MEWITSSARETRELGAALSSVLRPGDVLLLSGELGAGKSELSRGIAAGLGIPGVIPSPSFTILNVYEEGRIPLYHFDWYRLGSPEELYEMGMDECLGGDGIALVEWPDKAAEAVPERRLEITIEKLEDQSRRQIRCESVGGFELSGSVEWKGNAK